MLKKFTVPVMVLDDSAQAADIRCSKAPSDIWRRYARVKTYNKPEDWTPRTAIRDLNFDQPFGVVSHRTGLNWILANRAYLFQIASCNLRCEYCYIDQSGFLRTNDNALDSPPSIYDLTPEDAVQDFVDFNEQYKQDGDPVYAGAFRISGGEPMMPEFQPWLRRVITIARNHPMVPHVWIDTNLTNEPSDELYEVLSDPKVSVCGCFKPGYWSLDQQLDTVWGLRDAGVDTYLYYPADGNSENQFIGVMDDLRQIDYNFPLRLCVIEIRWKYSAMKDRKDMMTEEESTSAWNSLRDMWYEYIDDNYADDIALLPSHQVSIWENHPKWWEACQDPSMSI